MSIPMIRPSCLGRIPMSNFSHSAVLRRQFLAPKFHYATQTTSPSSNAAAAANRTAYLQARNATYKARNRNLLMYTASVLVLGIGVTYAAVPLYRLFCSATGFGGVPVTSGGGASHNAKFEAERLVAADGQKRIRITFNADCSDMLPWSFSPSQREVQVLPGETALAFYTATNKSKEDIIGIATYNVMPDKVRPIYAVRGSSLTCVAWKHRLHLISPRLNASASTSKSYWQAKKSIYQSSFLSTEISSMILP